MPWNGFGYDDDPTPPSSDRMVEEQTPYYQFAIEQFGAQRCMFESNFPVDKVSCSYTVLWNAFKRLTQAFSPDERRSLFHDTARTFYRV